MTAKRWEIVGGFVMGIIFIIAVNGIQPDPVSWRGLLIGIAAGMVGNGIGRWMVREWQQAGRE